MTLSKLDADTIALEFDVLDLLHTLGPVIESAQFEANAFGKTVRFSTSGNAFPIRGNRLYLERAVENVIRNAIHHTPEETTVGVSVQYGGKSVAILVTDDGSGVEEYELAKLFEPFYRSPRARAMLPGTGVGLALVARIMKLHTGTAQAKNLADGGLEVALTMPLYR